MEKTIIANLLWNKTYALKVLPYLKDEYFDGPAEQNTIKTIITFNNKYQEPPTKEALEVLIDKIKNLNEKSFTEVQTFINTLSIDTATNQEWLVEETEKFCRDKALYNAIRDAINIMDGGDKKKTTGDIPDLIQDALSISFDTAIGHDYFDDSAERYQYYHDVTERIQFDIDILNTITGGGLPRKTLTALLATSGAGKSLCLGHFAATSLMHGLNVLYITMELSEKEVGKRIDANLMHTDVNEIAALDEATYTKRIDRLLKKTPGKLLIKEYPPGSVHSGNFRFLLKELITKKNFQPDVILFDYVNLIGSARAASQNASTYTIVKLAAEDIRGLCIEFNAMGMTASQLNRSGYNNMDADATNTSESMGLFHTVDACFALITSEELEANNQILWKQLKNRFGNLQFHNKFVTGIERAKMKLYNTEIHAQSNIISSISSKKKDGKTSGEESTTDQESFSPSMFSSAGKKGKLFNVDVTE